MTRLNDLEHAVDEAINKLVAECPDPRAADYRRQYDVAAKEVRERYERWRKEALEERTEYHRTCAVPDPEAAARRDVDLMAIAVGEERDQLIAHHWKTFLDRLRRVLEDVKDEEDSRRP